ncbi:DUF4255 domain-containing protein [Mesorhizobium sp. M1348]|uniref:DUF4255 domain-containing protein n=1 Tax=unclassified Mesorhizobium TaxID=325217 RepID=UPI003337429A
MGGAMSNFEAIAAVTETLRGRLAAASGLSGTVTTEPLDKLAAHGANPALNLHLYQILPNAHWRNMDIPWKVKPGETGHAPLALDLRYLLTATAPKPTNAQKDLGIGMRVLHDNPVVDPGGAAVAPFERARVSMQPLSLDDMEKLWTGVSIPRLLSVAYEVSVVLIESEVPTRSPLPVLTRGTGSPDSIVVQGEFYPTIERVEIGDRKFDEWLRGGSRPGRTAAQIDDRIFLYGQGLPSNARAVIHSLMHAENPDHSEKKLVAADLSVSDRGGLTVDLSQLDFAAAKFPAGPCSISLEIKRDGQHIDITNAVPFSLAPKIISIVPGAAFTVPQDLTIQFNPPLVDNQAATLIVANRQVLSNTPPHQGDTSLAFRLEGVDPGGYPARLRVDGVDSVVVDIDKGISSSERPTFSNVVEVKK